MHFMTTPSARRYIHRGSAFLVFFTAALPAWAAADLDVSHAAVRAVIAMQNKVTGALMGNLQDDVIGTAVGLDPAGNPALVVYADEAGPNAGNIHAAMPAAINGIPVVVEVTEKFRAFAGKPGPAGPPASVNHKAKQTPPIQLGTSGGWSYDLANGYCCGGTLGSLIQVTDSQGNVTQYIMSNYHVFESDIVPGGNGIVATDGDPVIQPGLIDVSCNNANAQVAGTLHRLQSLPGNNVDVSIAQAAPGQVRTDGAILEIGALSAQTVTPFLKQNVKKSGRTTGLTSSTISGLNATVSVTYDNECAGGAAFTKTFTGQIIILNRSSKFLNSGDSGSLMVENVSAHPRAVGLLYAGSSSTAVANPIQEVLNFVGAKLGGAAAMVGAP